MYNIELKPHIGRDIRGCEVEHDQWMIYANGLHVGYVGHAGGSPITLFAPGNKSMERALRKSICEKLEEVRPVAVPPSDEQVKEHMKNKRAK